MMRRPILAALWTTVLVLSFAWIPPARALEREAAPTAGAVVVVDPAALALEASDLPRLYSISSDAAARDADVGRLAAAVEAAAKKDPSLDVAVAIQDLSSPSGAALALITIAVRRGDARAFAAQVARLRAGRYESRRYGNAILVFATDDRSQWTILAGATFGRYTRLARAAADSRAVAGDPAGALACLDTIFELAPEDPRAHVRAGEISAAHEPEKNAARGHFERAIQALEKKKPAARPKGLLLDARIGLARLDRDRGEALAAESALRIAAQECGELEPAAAARVGYEIAAAIAADPKRSKDALDALERALEDESKSGSPEKRLARRAAEDPAFKNVAGDVRFGEILARFGAPRRR